MNKIFFKNENNLLKNNYKHVFVLSSPIVIFIAKIIIEKYKILPENIYLVPLRNSNVNIINGNVINIKLTFLDKLFRKLFLFSLFGIRLRKIIENKCEKFIFYCDWDNRDNVEILNSTKCIAHAYVEEGQTAFNKFKLYSLKRNRISQWLRLYRWQKSSDLMTKNCADVPTFNEYFNDRAFAFFTLFKDSFPLINDSKKIILNEFNYVKKNYKPQLLGKKYIGLMCSPRRLKNDWSKSIRIFVDNLPEKAVIKLHPEFYANPILLIKFKEKLKAINSKEIEICNKATIVEAEMIYEKKILIGPLTSLEKYSKLLGSDFIRIEIY